MGGCGIECLHGDWRGSGRKDPVVFEVRRWSSCLWTLVVQNSLGHFVWLETHTYLHLRPHVRTHSGHLLQTWRALGDSQIVSLRFVAPWPQFWWKLSHVIHIWPSPRNPAFTWGFPDLFTSIRCSMALVFVESVAFRIEFAHRAIPLKPSMYLGIPRSFHFDSLLFDKS